MSVADPTLQELTDLLAKYRAAESACASGKSYTIDGDTLERHDLPAIRRAVDNIRRQIIDVEAATAGGQQGVRKPVWN